MRVFRIFSSSARSKAVVASALSALLLAAVPSSAHATDGSDGFFRCEVIGGEHFCTDMGFVDPRVAQEIREEAARALLAGPEPKSGTGAETVVMKVAELARLSESELATRQERQLADARSSHAMRLERSQDGSTLMRPSLQAAPMAGGIYIPPPGSLVPASASIMGGYSAKSVKQERSYWCGPATVAAIARGNGVSATQSTWAKRLGTTTSGTGIEAMVSVINNYTTWDKSGKYAVINISGAGVGRLENLVKSNVGVRKRPVVMHPTLLREYFSYLERDHGGHFQVGRGYTASSVKIIEVYNEADFWPGKPSTAGYQSVSFKKMYNATMASSSWLRTIGA